MNTKRKVFSSYCFNPLSKPNHSNVRKALRNVPNWLISRPEFSHIPPSAKICDRCRKELQNLIKASEEIKQPYGEIEQPCTSDTHDETTTDPSFMSDEFTFSSLNQSLIELGASPVKKKKVSLKEYANDKMNRISEVIKQTIFKTASSPDAESEEETPDEALLAHLVDQFKQLDTREKKLMLLTLIPGSWSRRKIMEKFSVSARMVTQSRQLRESKGLLASPDQKPGRALPVQTVQMVRDFYQSDEIGRVMPGKKDCISTKNEDGSKVCIQKRLLLANLKEIYELFKEKNPDVKIGFSKFAELRPKNCILVGPKGTHTVCVCLIHQNVKLMIENGNLRKLTNWAIADYRKCLNLMMYIEPTANCYFGKCFKCPGVKKVEDILEAAFEEHVVEFLTFRQWMSVDRCNLELITKPANEFIEIFSEKLLTLRPHHYVAKQQSLFLKKKKESLQAGEAIVIGDFAENFSFVVQDEAQSFHWTNHQATIHPFIVYFSESSDSGQKLNHLSFVVISDCLEHNTIAVHTFQKKLIEFLRSDMCNATIEKLYYFSDGSSAQYKNRYNFNNTTYHEEDFQMTAEWHCFATAHGKGPCDGLGGTVKRLATKASLQRPFDKQILTARALFEWAQEAIKNINFQYVTYEEYRETEDYLRERLERAVTVQGTRKYHAFIPTKTRGRMFVKLFSLSSDIEEKSTERGTTAPSFQEMIGYVIVVYNEAWYLGYILEKNEEESILHISFLEPSGPAPSYKYPQREDRLWCDASQVLSCVNPTTPTGRTYNLSEEDNTKAIEAFNAFREKQRVQSKKAN